MICRMAPKSAIPLLLAILVGLLGITFSLFPSTFFFPSHCPASILALRNKVYNLFFGAGFRQVHERNIYPPPRAINSSTGLPIWAAVDLLPYGNCEEMPASGRVLLAVNNFVYDVTELGGVFYGPKSGYCLFAGHDATRSLALGSLSQEDLDRAWDVEGVGEEAIQEQHLFYLNKYGPPIGHCCGTWIIPPAAPPGKPAEEL